MSPFVTRIAVFATVAVAASAAPAAAAVRAPSDRSPLGDERLSNERTVTRWAHVATPTAVRTAPRRIARTVARTHYWTEHGRPEVYLVLESRRVRRTPWVRVRVPGRPNGRTGWVPARSLGVLHVVRTRLVVDRGSLRATLYRSGRAIWRARVGVGTASTPTPPGSFYVREKLPGGGGVFGPWAFGTSAYSTLDEWAKGGVIGIHGTNQPELLPGRPSHGCIRVRNGEIRRLVALMPVGTPVQIR